MSAGFLPKNARRNPLKGRVWFLVRAAAALFLNIGNVVSVV